MGLTIEEWEELKRQDPLYEKRREERAAEMAERQRLLWEDAAPLKQDLKAIGWDVNTAWDLLTSKRPYPEAILILMHHARQPYLDRNKEGIARALAIPGASFLWPFLESEFRAAPNRSGYKMGLGLALSTVVKSKEIDKLIELAKDRSQGQDRLMLLARLRRSKLPQAKQALMDLRDDPDFAAQYAAWKFK